MQIIDETPISFPVISICDSNAYTTLAGQLMLDKLMKQFTLRNLNNSYGISQMGFFNFYLAPSKSNKSYRFYRHLSLEVFNYAVSLTFNTSFTDSQRKALGWDLFKVLKSCTFNEANCEISKDFEWYFSVDYGNCFRFNPGSNKNVV